MTRWFAAAVRALTWALNRPPAPVRVVVEQFATGQPVVTTTLWPAWAVPVTDMRVPRESPSAAVAG